MLAYMRMIFCFLTQICILSIKPHKKKKMLNIHFNMKDLGKTNFIVGIEITKICDDIFLNLLQYIEIILKKYNCIDCNHVFTHSDYSIRLLPYQG